MSTVTAYVTELAACYQDADRLCEQYCAAAGATALRAEIARIENSYARSMWGISTMSRELRLREMRGDLETIHTTQKARALADTVCTLDDVVVFPARGLLCGFQGGMAVVQDANNGVWHIPGVSYEQLRTAFDTAAAGTPQDLTGIQSAAPATPLSKLRRETTPRRIIRPYA